MIGGTPVLIIEEASVFAPSDYQAPPARRARLRSSVRAWIDRLLPKTVNSSDFNMDQAVQRITCYIPHARILVLGCGENTEGRSFGARFVYTDVTFGSLGDVICDAHDLPFADSAFDAVIASAVLEHVLQPWRCIAEIERVLVPGGFVFATTPFMQQVHMGSHDFTRFTHLGHRALFSAFEELRAGIANGPGTALAWSLQYFALSLFSNSKARTLVALAARLFTRPLCALDRWFLNRRPGAYDAASAFYFFGRKADRRLAPRETLAFYRGFSPR